VFSDSIFNATIGGDIVVVVPKISLGEPPLLTQYNTGLVCVLERHATLLKKLVTIRSDNPWETDEIRDARRFSRKMERRWRSRGLVIYNECLLSSGDPLKQLISAVYFGAFLNSKIADCRGRKSLFKIVDTFLLKKPGRKLLHHVTLDELVKRFSEFFVQKIENIRAVLEAAGPPCQPDQHTQAGALTSFASVSVADVASFLKSCPVKSSLRDPIPTFFLLEFADLLLHPITKIINLSLSPGVFPDEMKLALVTPVNC
jgi:hypothetical protein